MGHRHSRHQHINTPPFVSSLDILEEQERRAARQMPPLPPAAAARPPRPPHAQAPPPNAQHASNRQQRANSTPNPRLPLLVSPAHPGNDPSNLYCPQKFNEILANPVVDKEVLEEHAWNPEDRSPNIVIVEGNPLMLHRHPVAQSTDCIRGKVGFEKGFHVWKIVWPRTQRGTNAVVGVATKAAPLFAAGYSNLVGDNAESYGWDLNRNRCGFDCRRAGAWPYPVGVPTHGPNAFAAPDELYCILDMDEGTLSFATEQHFLGVAFRGLKGKQLYPIVGCVWGNCEIAMEYVGNRATEPRPLMDICRRSLAKEYGDEFLRTMNRLQLPMSIKRYLMYED